MGIIRGRLGERPPPFGNRITIGESPFYQHTDGNWYNKETHERAEVKTLDELFKELEAENERKRQEVNK